MAALWAEAELRLLQLPIAVSDTKRNLVVSTHQSELHMGWNAARIVRMHPVFEGIEDQSEFYFVHSYYCQLTDQADALMTTDYAGVSFSSAIGRDNLLATQFHPERSGRIGLKLLENFSKWGGSC